MQSNQTHAAVSEAMVSIRKPKKCTQKKRKKHEDLNRIPNFLGQERKKSLIALNCESKHEAP